MMYILGIFAIFIFPLILGWKCYSDGEKKMAWKIQLASFFIVCVLVYISIIGLKSDGTLKQKFNWFLSSDSSMLVSFTLFPLGISNVISFLIFYMLANRNDKNNSVD